MQIAPKAASKIGDANFSNKSRKREEGKMPNTKACSETTCGGETKIAMKLGTSKNCGETPWQQLR